MMDIQIGRTLSVSALATLAFAMIAGCGPSLPEGMPEVFPCTIEVVDGGTAIEGVKAVLVPETSMQNTNVFGLTGASGTATVQTRYSGAIVDGAPAGAYKVTLYKQHMIEHTKTEAERAEMSDAELAAYGAERQKQREALGEIIPKVLTQAAGTPLAIEVTPDGAATLSVDVSEY